MSYSIKQMHCIGLINMKIEKNTKYKILGKSKYFKGKYGTFNPIIIIEDLAIKVFGESWGIMNGNPTAMLFGMRAGMEDLNGADKDVYYEKVDGLAELIELKELEKI